MLDFTRRASTRKVGRRETLIERKADGLDGNIWGSRLSQERSQDSGRHVTTSTDSNHELRLEMLKDLWRRFLAEFVDLIIGHVEFLNHCESAE